MDADFVKNTIIQSMADEDHPIDLQTYRRLVTDFEREYDEIDCWFRQTRDGVLSRTPASTENRLNKAVRLLQFDQQLLDVWHMLNYVVADDEQQIPLLESKLVDVRNNIEKESKRQKELKADYDKEKDSLNQRPWREE